MLKFWRRWFGRPPDSPTVRAARRLERERRLQREAARFERDERARREAAVLRHAVESARLREQIAIRGGQFWPDE